MTHYVAWSPYTGSSSVLLAGFLLIVSGIFAFSGWRLHRSITVLGPGKYLRALLIACLCLAIMTFLIAITAYGLADQQQGLRFSLTNPITPVTFTAAILSFFVILYLTRMRGPGIAIGSAIVGTMAAPMIFELPFDLLVMWHTYPPSPTTLYTLLYFLPLILVELLSFALLSFSPALRLSRYTFFLLAGMFLVFTIWALFGFAYPSAPLPIALNMLSKIVAFATAISLFLPAPLSKTPGEVVAKDEVSQAEQPTSAVESR